MTIEASLVSAFLVALLGGTHCAAMCGGIVGALTWGLPPATRGRFAAMLPFLLAYNAGRIASYALAGALAGGAGAWVAHWTTVYHGQQALQLGAGVFMVALGLYVSGWWLGLARLERAGAGVWRTIEPLGRRWLPIRTPAQALALGLIWGWLPCGLVYTVLIWAVGAGGALAGSLLMLSFGLGTLPALLAMGAFAASLSAWLREPWVRHGAGLLIIAFGVYQIGSVIRAIFH